MLAIPGCVQWEVGVAPHSRLILSASYYSIMRQIYHFPRAVIKILRGGTPSRGRWGWNISSPADPLSVGMVAIVALSYPTSIRAICHVVLPDSACRRAATSISAFICAGRIALAQSQAFYLAEVARECVGIAVDWEISKVESPTKVEVDVLSSL